MCPLHSDTNVGCPCSNGRSSCYVQLPSPAQSLSSLSFVFVLTGAYPTMVLWRVRSTQWPESKGRSQIAHGHRVPHLFVPKHPPLHCWEGLPCRSTFCANL
eukprot:EG_transcript_22330